MSISLHFMNGNITMHVLQRSNEKKWLIQSIDYMYQFKSEFLKFHGLKVFDFSF